MSSITARASSVIGTSGTTWATTTSAVDGTYGTNNATYCTYVNASRSTTGYIELGGFNFSSVPSGATGISLSVTLRSIESSTSILAITFQPYDGTTAIGSAFGVTENTSAHSSTTTFTPTVAQLQSANFKIRVTAVRTNTTTSTTFSVDYVDVNLTWTDPVVTPSAVAAVAALPAISSMSGGAILATAVQTGIGPSVSNDYESSIGTAYVSTGALSQSTDVADSGTHSMKFVPSNGTTPIVWLRGGASQVASQGMAAQQGQTVTFTVKMRRDAAQNDVSWSLSLQFYDSGGSYVAGAGGGGAVISSSGFSVKTISYPITDSGVAWVLPRVVAGGALNASPVYFDDLSLSILGSIFTPTVNISSDINLSTSVAAVAAIPLPTVSTITDATIAADVVVARAGRLDYREDFEVGLGTITTAFTGSVVRSTDYAASGTYSAKATASTGQCGIRVDPLVGSFAGGGFAANGGRQLRISFKARAHPSQARRGMMVSLSWDFADGSGGDGDGVDVGTITDTEFTTIDLLYVIPAGISRLIVIASTSNSVLTADPIYFDDVIVTLDAPTVNDVNGFQPTIVAGSTTIPLPTVSSDSDITAGSVVSTTAIPLPTVTTSSPDATVTAVVVQAVATPIRPAFDVAITAAVIAAFPGHLDFTFDSTIQGAHVDPYTVSNVTLSWNGTQGHTQAGSALAVHTNGYAMYVAFLPIGAATYVDWSPVTYGQSYPITLWVKARDFGTSATAFVREYNSSGTQLSTSTLTTLTTSTSSWLSLGGTYTPSSSNVAYAYVTVSFSGLNPLDSWGYYFDDFSGFGTPATTIPAPRIVPGPAQIAAVATLPTPTITSAASIDLRTPTTISFVNYAYDDDPMGYAEIGVPSGTQVGDLLISTGSGNMGGNYDGSWHFDPVGLYWKIATSGDLSASWNFGDDTFNAVIVMFTYRGTAATPLGPYAHGEVSTGPYVAPSIDAALATDLWLAFFTTNGSSATVGSTGFTMDAFPGIYGIAHRQLSAAGPTGTASFPSVGGLNGSATSFTLATGGAPDGLNIKIAATAAIPAPTVSANSSVTATLVTAVVAVRSVQPSLGPTLVLSVAAVPLPTVVTQTDASITAVLVTATSAVPDAHPPISAVLVTATTTQPRPAFHATVTAVQVSGVTAVIRPAFNTTITAAAVAAVSSLTGSAVSPGPITIAAVAALSRPAFDVSITATSTPTVAAIALPQSPATITAAAVLAMAAVTTERPAINVVVITAVTSISLPQSPATITATAVPVVSAVIRPAFHVSITGLTDTAATTTLTGYAARASSTVTASVTDSTAATPFATVHLYKMGAYKPNVLYTLTNLTGSYTDIQDSPDTPDANALVPTGGAIVVRMGFEEHSQAMRTQPEDQKFRVVVKVP